MTAQRLAEAQLTNKPETATAMLNHQDALQDRNSSAIPTHMTTEQPSPDPSGPKQCPR